MTHTTSSVALAGEPGAEGEGDEGTGEELGDWPRFAVTLVGLLEVDVSPSKEPVVGVETVAAGARAEEVAAVVPVAAAPAAAAATPAATTAAPAIPTPANSFLSLAANGRL